MLIPTKSVMIAGLPGKMATLVAQAVVKQEDMFLYGLSLGEKFEELAGLDQGPIKIVPTDEHIEVLAWKRKEIDLIVDFTQPNSANHNAKMYCEAGIPFVMGTTGGDREKLLETVGNSQISAVIAPNMAVPVVIFQEMIKFAADNFPEAFDGYELSIRESHQQSKKDPSGTAVFLLDYFQKLGMPFSKDEIKMLRDPQMQSVVHRIPDEHLGGHGFHTYGMTSGDKTVFLEFTHNVLGRKVYVDGALRAIRFLLKHLGEKGKVFSMADVLRG